MADLTGEILGKYRISRQLDRTEVKGVGVFLGEHIQLGMEVAIKIRPATSDLAKGLEHEARILARLNHPHIVKALEFGAERDFLYLVMNYAPLGTVSRHFGPYKLATLSAVLPFVKQIAEALQYLHDLEIIHGCVAPANILLHEYGETLLCDFEAAMTKDGFTTDNSHRSFILSYAAPEQLMGILHQASDQYSLASMLYEWLTGDTPFPTSGVFDLDRYKQTHPPVSPRSKNPTLPPQVEEVLMTALAVDPKQRFANVKAFANAFEQASVPETGVKMVGYVGHHFASYRLIKNLRSHADLPLSSYVAEHTHSKDRTLVRVIPLYHHDLQMRAVRLAADGPLQLQHPHVLGVVNFGIQSQAFFLVPKQTTSVSLRERHPKGTALSLDSIAAYTKQIADTLHFAHTAGFSFGYDEFTLGPENILIDHNNAILLDFSVSFVHELFLTDNDGERLLPTCWYLAPEILVGGHTHRSPFADQYALGAIVYEWLTGTPPFWGSSLKVAKGHLLDTPSPVRDKCPDLSPAVEGVVLTALEKKPEHRIPSVKSFGEALEKALFPKQKQRSPGLTGKRLKNYQLVHLVGQGSFGAVYLGEHVRLGIQAAIKVLHERPSDEESKKFLAEARVLANLDHPHILRVLEFDEEDEIPFLVTAYAPNGTLRDRHPKGVKLPLATIVAYIKQASDALQHAHDARLIHLDLKPENFLLGKSREILVGDFGIAVILQQSKSHQMVGNFAGTPIYAAPEQFENRPGIGSDQYALGIVVYEWLTGSWPFQGEWWAIGTQKLTTPPTPLRDKVPTISAAVESVVLKALARDAKDRYPSVQAFATALEEASKN